ncbi:MAG: GTPase Era [Aquiluna sp.]|jgi:GTPase|uniref:GTPase Era n=1 Tax=Aquiluna sp. TaxID=2053504 RepID=UPI00276B6ACB|nr:GTPase Era [Aquiluna sp.]MDP5026038.1 GTPase Era [Aquiluna sp.]
MKSGFVSFVGRPNVGKSTLTNAIVGEKVAITSSKPQTTRKAIRAIHSTEQGQLIIVDTPGLHRPRTLLGQRLNNLVETTLNEVDLIAFCSPANEAIGVGDKKIIADIAQLRAKKVAIVTKADTVSREKLAQHLMSVSEVYDWDEIIPVSALTGEQVGHLVDVLISKLDDGPQLYPTDIHTEETDEDRICELVREAALELVRDEMPHSLAVTLDEIVEGEQKQTLHVSLWVERDSQKGIVIGKAGSMLKTIGTKARREIEELLGSPIHLAIQVRIAKDWQRDSKQLGKLGF